MGENLLSLLHIQKLGHPIEEIRIRALASIISKYNLNLVDKSNLENTKTLVEKLLNWFNFDECSEEKKVISLLHTILGSSGGRIIVSQTGKNILLKKIDSIENKIGCKYSLLFEEIRKCIKVSDATSQNLIQQNVNSSDLATKQLLSNGINNKCKQQNKCKCDTEHKLGLYTCDMCPLHVISNGLDNFSQPEEKTSQDSRQNVVSNKSVFKVQIFPWQNLVSNDKKVLSSIFDGLKYIDNSPAILQSCQFFSEVAVRDFPVEVFIQRPLIVRTFVELTEVLQGEMKVPVIQCLVKVVQCLKRCIKLSLQTEVFNTKREFYTTSVYPEDTNSENHLNLNGLSDNFYYNFMSLDEDYHVNQGNGVNDHKLKKHQLPIPDFCFEVLFKVVPQFKKKCSEEETNYILLLFNEYLTCIILNLKSKSNECCKDLKSKLYTLFVIIHELLKYHQTENKIIYVIVLSILTKLLNSLRLTVGMQLEEILPKFLQQELGLCIFDSSLYMLFPQLHAEIVEYLEGFSGKREREFLLDYKEMKLVLQSMKSSITFSTKQDKLKTKMEKLECVYQGLPSLHFHEHLDFILVFIKSCLLKWSKSELNDKELKLREKILLKLLSHSSNKIRIYTYKMIGQFAEELLGEKEAMRAKYEYPGDKMDFLFHVDVWTEIICHGLSSDLEEVSSCSSSIVSHMLKSKFLMSDACWCDFLNVLTPCLSLLQCLADKSTSLGRCIIKMFDPDLTKSIGLSHLELIKGNIRLLFSKNSLTRDEAISRLFWLLNREDLEQKKLPKMSVLTSLNLSGICSSVKPVDFTNIQQSLYNPGKLCDVLEMLSSETLEPNLRRSVLTQLNVMLEDVNLHPTFLEQEGLKLIVGILNDSLVETKYCYYPDSVIPVIDILRQLTLNNLFVCQELSSKTGVFYNVLRSLFLFSGDDRLRRNAVELLCLLLYGDCILRVPSEKSNKRILSFPEIVVEKMCLPFVTHVHWKNSKHFEPSPKKTLMGKENCSNLIRVYWAVQWVGNLSDILKMKQVELQDRINSPGIPDDMKISHCDITNLAECSFTHSVKKLLRDIQNATTHETVCVCIHKLQNYIMLYNVEKARNIKNSTCLVSDNVLSHMVWESTLERFMLIMPGCMKDEYLLLLVVRFIQLLLESFLSERLVSWTEKFLTDVNKPLFKTLKNMEMENSGLKGRELRLAIMELMQQIVNSKQSVESKKWFPYVELISDQLKLDKTANECSNVAYFDWLIALLVDLTRKCSFGDKPRDLKNLIVRIMEIVIAFHCTPDSAISFMGLNIVKNSLFALNHILSDTQINVENWEELWFQALSDVIGNVEKINYCWLLSLWFMRDPIVRASALHLFVGFSTTAKGCELLIDQLNIPFKYIWSEGFKILFDEKESCVVKEKSGLLLANLASHGTKLSSGGFIENLKRINFVPKALEIIENFRPEGNLSELVVDEVGGAFTGEMITTPALVTSVTTLLHNIVLIDSDEINGILKSGLLESLTRVLGEIPESAVDCDSHKECMDILNMYITVCRLVTKCVTSNKDAHTCMIHSHYAINCLFSMVNYNLFCESSKTIRVTWVTLWSGIFNLFSALLTDPVVNDANDHSAFILLNRCMSENGVDHFISSLHIALTSDSSALRLSVLEFLINLFGHEMAVEKNTSIRDIFDRNIPEKALDLSRNYGSKEFDIPSNVKLNFGIRLTDILLQIFLSCNDCPTHSLKPIIYEALGGLFTIYEPAQNFCVDQNFAACVVLNLKKICIKLNMENACNFKKLSEKKKIEPLLQDVENLFQLITNFTYKNESAKNEIANKSLSVVIHKLWPWCLMKDSLQLVVLKLLCTFTHNCNQACRSLVLSSNFTVMSLKKMPGSMTLLNAILNQVTIEMDSISKRNQSQVLCLCLQLLTNCCKVTECRSFIPKGNLLQCFTKLQSNRKKRPCGDAVIESWIRFLIAFSSHQEGQLALAKNQDVLDIIMGMANTSKPNQRLDSLIVLRNICFHQLNRYRMLNWGSFLSLLTNALDSSRREEVQQAVSAIWALACNSQKDKLILRSAGFEIKLEGARRNSVVNEDADTAEQITTVLGVLRNK